MSRKLVIAHSVWLVCTVSVVWLLYRWAFMGWGFPDDGEGPRRFLFRLAFMGFIAVLLLSAQVLVVRKLRL